MSDKEGKGRVRIAPPNRRAVIRYKGPSFATLLGEHLVAGIRPDGTRREWTPQEFGGVVVPNSKEQPGRSVNQWLVGTHAPNSLAPITRALFGNNPALADLRDQLQMAWHAARRRRPRKKMPVDASNAESTDNISSTDAAELKRAAQIIDDRQAETAARSAEQGQAIQILPDEQPSLPWLPLEDAFQAKKPNYFSLLHWRYRLVARLYGRDQEIARIVDWARNPTLSPMVRLVTGPAGAGKTRLVAAVAEQLRNSGWTAGFVSRDLDASELLKGKGGLFLAIDYPEERQTFTSSLLDRVGEITQASIPVRIVLVSRRSFREWERELTMLAGRFGSEEIASPGPLELSDAFKLVQDAVAQTSLRTGNPIPDMEAATAWLEMSPHHRLPLYATAAAIYAVTSTEAPFSLRAPEVLRQIALRERERVKRTSKEIGLGTAGLERLLSLAVLADGLDQETISTLVDDVSGGSVRSDVASSLASTPYWSEGRLARLQPDLLAAAFLKETLLSPFRGLGQADVARWMFRSLRGGESEIGQRLGRLMYDIDSLSDDADRSDELGRMLQTMIADFPEDAALFSRRISGEIPFPIAEFAARAANEAARQTADPAMKAAFLRKAASYFSLRGDRADALVKARDAVRILREHGPRRELASGLVVLAKRLSDLGIREEALSVSREAVAICRESVQADAADLEPELAEILSNLSVLLSEMGQFGEALDIAREAVSIEQKLFDSGSFELKPRLAKSLNVLATMLLETGDTDEAYTVSERVLSLFRELEASEPEKHAPGLALALNNHATVLMGAGDPALALAAIEEAVRIRRRLWIAWPRQFEADLAMSVINLAGVRHALSMPECLASAEEAASLYRGLARGTPGAFDLYYAMSLSNVAAMAFEAGLHEKAIDSGQAAVDELRKSASDNPGGHLPYLIASLSNLADMLLASGRNEVATSRAAEAARLCMQIDPNSFPASISPALPELSRCLRKLGRSTDADAIDALAARESPPS